MGLLGKVTRDALGGMMPGAALGAGAGAMAGVGQPAFEQADSAALGMGMGALAGAGVGGASSAIKRITAQLFQNLKRAKPGISDMEAWAMAEREAHDMAMSQRGNPPISPPGQLLLK